VLIGLGIVAILMESETPETSSPLFILGCMKAGTTLTLALVGKKLRNVLESFDYPRMERASGSSPYFPEVREWPAVYLANRILLGESGEF
jgi:hypothetical protein